jgi:hypothetical protein
MKKLFEKLFKKEPPPNYVMAEFAPIKVNHVKAGTKVTEYEDGKPVAHDEMDIDRIHQRN